MSYLWMIFCLSFAFACERHDHDPLRAYEKSQVAQRDPPGQINGLHYFLKSYSKNLIKQNHLQRYLKNFPYKEYKIHKVSRLGRFYIDDIPDGIKSHLRQGIYWEFDIAEYVRKYTRKGTVAIDLGAHIGIHTLTMSKCVGKNGLVIAFEPQHKMFRELWHNIRLNKRVDNIVLLPLAVGEKEEDIEMAPRNIYNEGGCRIGKGGDRTHMVTLDSLKLKNISFIKMDVESYELNVLKGATQTIKENKPVIVFEILGEVDLDHLQGEAQSYMNELMSLLESLDYKIEKIYGNDFIAQPLEK